MKILKGAVLCSLIVTSSIAQAKPTAEITSSVFASQSCLVTGDGPLPGGQAFIGVVAAILLPVVVELGIDALSNELKKVRTVKRAGEMNFDLYALSNQRMPIRRMPGCITVVTGEMPTQSRIQESGIQADVAVSADSDETTILSRLNNNNVHVDSGKLYSVIEIEVETSADGTAFRYAPRYIKVLKLIPGNTAKTQGLAVNLSMSGAGASPNGTVYSLAPISFGAAFEGLALDRVKDADKLEEMKTGYLTMPGMS